MQLQYREKGNRENPKKAVIYLHGYGSNGANLISLTPFLRYDSDTIFIAPSAPFVCDEAYGMADSFQWFSLYDTANPARPRLGAKDILAGANKMLPVINGLIKHVTDKYSLETTDIALVGFSQGTMLALHYALHSDTQLAGILGYSGKLMFMPKNNEIATRNFCLIHGTDDMVVEYSNLEDAHTKLTSLGLEVSQYSCAGLDHSIDEQGIEIGKSFLQATLSQ